MSAATSEPMRIFPSTLAAVVAGAVVMPLFVLGWRFIEAVSRNQAFLILWFVVAFFIPVLFATADLKYAARRRRELGGFFRPLTSAGDFRLFYIPAWRRLFVWFISTVASVLALKALGVEL
jgi:hypothetical protein